MLLALPSSLLIDGRFDVFFPATARLCVHGLLEFSYLTVGKKKVLLASSSHFSKGRRNFSSNFVEQQMGFTGDTMAEVPFLNLFLLLLFLCVALQPVAATTVIPLRNKAKQSIALMEPLKLLDLFSYEPGDSSCTIGCQVRCTSHWWLNSNLTQRLFFSLFLSVTRMPLMT